jgi:acyl-CoA hydrolase
MSKFTVVTEAPQGLSKNEYVIDKTNFFEEIALHKTKTPRNGLTGAFHLRMILDSIAQNYDPENMTAYSCKVHHYEGRPFSSDEELNTVLVEMLQRDCPAVFSKYLDKKIKTRPKGIDTVYYVDSGLANAVEIFYQNGFSNLEKAED